MAPLTEIFGSLWLESNFFVNVKLPVVQVASKMIISLLQGARQKEKQFASRLRSKSKTLIIFGTSASVRRNNLSILL